MSSKETLARLTKEFRCAVSLIKDGVTPCTEPLEYIEESDFEDLFDLRNGTAFKLGSVFKKTPRDANGRTLLVTAFSSVYVGFNAQFSENAHYDAMDVMDWVAHIAVLREFLRGAGFVDVTDEELAFSSNAAWLIIGADIKQALAVLDAVLVKKRPELDERQAEVVPEDKQ